MSPSDPEVIPNEGLAAVTPEEQEASAARPKMSAADALARLQRGEALKDVRVDRLRFRGDFPQPVRMVNVHLHQPVFDGATFAAELRLERCTLERPRFYKPTVCQGALALTGSTLVLAQLRDLTVKGRLGAANVQARGKMLWQRCRFEGPVSFWEATFRGWAEFKECEFLSEVDFRSFHAHEGFILMRSRCAGDVL